MINSAPRSRITPALRKTKIRSQRIQQSLIAIIGLLFNPNCFGNILKRLQSEKTSSTPRLRNRIT